MSILQTVIIVVGLIVFEVVISVDNAIINAHILKSMTRMWRRRFLIFGIFTSVFMVRFLMPLFIVWISTSSLTSSEILQIYTGDSHFAAEKIEASKPFILMFGGIFLMYLYLHWLFLEKKNPLFVERYLNEKHGVWFFAFVAIILVVVMYLARGNSNLMLAASIGSAIFFILYGFKENAEKKQRRMMKERGRSGFSKFLYLEVLDMTFSFDSVIGAFAFTTNLLLILIGIGVGAMVVRELTIVGIDRVTKYKWLKNGAMTSIGFLAFFMIIEAFGMELPEYIPTLAMLFFVGIAFYKSHKFLEKLRSVEKAVKQEVRDVIPGAKGTQSIEEKPKGEV